MDKSSQNPYANVLPEEIKPEEIKPEEKPYTLGELIYNEMRRREREALCDRNVLIIILSNADYVDGNMQAAIAFMVNEIVKAGITDLALTKDIIQQSLALCDSPPLDYNEPQHRVWHSTR